MLKSAIFATAAFALAASPAIAKAPQAETTTFVHDGQTYVYTVEHKGDYRILRGTNNTTGQKFELRVSGQSVKGAFGGADVSFSVNSVRKNAPAAVLASD
jgi:hypothetical protein